MGKGIPTPDQFARVYGHPGEASRSAGWFRVLWPVFLSALIGGYLIRVAFPYPSLSMPVAGLLLLGLGFLTLVLLLKGEKKMGQFLKGAEGEERMARILSLLPASYAVFHGLPSKTSGGGHDFDHVVVGPTGVYIIETKNWSGSVKLEGEELLYRNDAETGSMSAMKRPDRPPLDQVRHSGRLLEAFLESAKLPEVTVQPVLCFASNVFSGGASGVGGVVVCNADRLNRVLTDNLDSPLSDQTVRAVELFLKGSMSA